MSTLIRSLEGGRVPLAHNPRASDSSTGSTTGSTTTAVTMVDSMTATSGQGLAQGPGLRQDTFTAFTILHFIGHQDIAVPLGTHTLSLCILKKHVRGILMTQPLVLSYLYF